MNKQPPEKADRRDDGSVVVHSIFHTIQGEGPFAGMPAVFIRLAGCNLQCPMCDTEYTAQRLRMNPDHILREVVGVMRDAKCVATRLIVITGGEPFRQNLRPLLDALMDVFPHVQIETNGTFYQELPYSSPGLTIVCSPKTSVVHKLLVPHVAAFKYVATAGSIAADGLPLHALDHPNAKGLYRPSAEWRALGRDIYLQPVDEGQDIFANAYNRDAVVKSCLTHGYRLCLQIHKDIGVP